MPPMTFKIRFALIGLAFLASIPSHGDRLLATEKSAKLTPVRIAYVSRSVLDMPYLIARDRGLFREEGLEPELIFKQLDLFAHAGL